MNHKWVNNICVRCGARRERKEHKKIMYVGSVLRNGVFEDKEYFNFGYDWYFNNQTFERPECTKILNYAGANSGN